MKYFVTLGVAILAFTPLPAAIQVDAVLEGSLQDVGIVEIRMKNTYDQEVTGARAWVFLLDAEGKVVGTHAGWVVGSDGDPETEDQPALVPGTEVKRSVSVPTRGAAVRTKVTFSRIILEDGAMPNPQEALEPFEEG